MNWKSKFEMLPLESPVMAGIAAGLYPLTFYFDSNFTLVNSWEHLLFFLVVFIAIPIAIFSGLRRLFLIGNLQRWQRYVLPFLNFFSLLFFISICLHGGIQKKLAVGIVFLACILAFFLYKQFKKIILLELLLAAIGLVSLGFTIVASFDYSDAWKSQPDAIAGVKFKSTPNIYYLQPDGYVNFSELNKGYYRIENSEFEQFLAQENFVSEPDFRSNYDATLSSNSATFAMKHHYYEGNTKSNELIHSREAIVGSNAVLDIFKNNGYKTYFLTERPYLLLNRPKLGFDVCNFKSMEIPFIGSGLDIEKDVLAPLALYSAEETVAPKFFFVEIFNPKHINGDRSVENAVVAKRASYIEDLHRANQTLSEAIKIIKKNDPQALILIMADHGGYVGMEYLQQGGVKTQDRDLVHSIFSSMFAIHWPPTLEPTQEIKFKSAVNVFRILFSQLSENEAYLNNQQEDASYMLIYEGAKKGVYKYINSTGKVVFEAQQ